MKNRRLALLLALSLGAGSLGLSGCAGEEERQQQYYRKAQTLYDAGNYEKASVEIRNALQINGDFPDGRYLHALIYEKDQNWQQMWANLNLVLELDPKHQKALLKLSQMQFMNGMYDDVLKNAATVLETDPGNADAHMLLGSVYIKQGKAEEAVQEANLALQTQPGHVGAISVLTEVYKTSNPELALKIIGDGYSQVSEKAVLGMLKIDVLISNNRIDDAVQAYKELIQEYPENLLFYYRLITLLQEHGRVDEAEDQLRSVVKAKPESTELKLWLAEFIATRRDLDKAEGVLKEFLVRQPDLIELKQALARVYVAKGEFSEAEKVYQSIIATQQTSSAGLEARNALVELYYGQGKEAAGDAMLLEIFELESENSRALVTRAKVALSKGDPKVAISDLRTVAKNQAEPIEALMLLASAHEMEGDYELALDNYRQVIALRSSEVPALVKAARLEMNFNNREAAEGLLKTALRQQPGHPQIIGMLVENYSRQQRWDEGLTFANSLIADEKVSALGYYVKGRLLAEKGDLSAAESALQQCLTLQPDAIEGLNYLVTFMVRQGKVDEAQVFLENHLLTYPAHLHAAERLGELLLRRDPAKALVFYQQQLTANPQALSLTIGLGQAYEVNGQPAQAINTYEKGVALAPDNAVVAVMLAGQYQLQGNYARAEQLYKQALRNEPSSLVAANNLATLYLDHLNTPENVEATLGLAKILRGTQQPIFLDTLGWINYHNGNTPSAISFFQSAIATGKAPVETHYHLARAYVKESKPDLAKQELNVALSKSPEAPLMQQIQALLGQIGKQG
jgi:tetratricopeptide (TPR) repeat protein